MDGMLALLKVKVIKGTNLAVRDWNNSDPYVRVQLGTQSVKTRVIKKSLTPVWDEELTLYIPKKVGPLKLIMDASILSTTKVICEIFRWHSTVIFQRNSLLLRSLLTNTAPDIQGHLQALCLKRGVVLVQLKNALFAESNEIWELGADLLYLMIEGNYDSRKLLESLVPKGIMLLYNSDALDDTSMQISGNDESIIRLSKWIDTVEVLRKDTLATPLLVWNDMKRNELSKFLDSELKRFYAALEINSELSYNSPDVELAYPVVSEGEGSVIGGVHLDLLPEKLSSLSVRNDALWQIKDPISLFQSVFQSMVLGFTPFFGHNNLPEVDLRLAAHALTWIYERHADNLLLSLTSLNVIEAKTI